LKYPFRFYIFGVILNYSKMRRIFVVIALFILSSGILMAQGPVSKGGKQVNAGLGFDSWGIPIYAGIDFGVHPDISVGGEFAFASENGISMVAIIGNGNYHFNRLLEIPRNWDVYAGLNLGIYMTSWSGPGSVKNSSHSEFDLGIQLGGRYYFSNKWGVNFEFKANSFPDAKIGISYRF
jgi:outer membrane immunogenic protein